MTIRRLAPALRSNGQGIPDLALAADGNLAMVADAEAVGQHAAQRLQTFESEWFLDTTAGVPWLERIMGRKVDLPLAESVMKAEIMDTNGVTGIEAFDLRFDRKPRRLNLVRADVGTEYDEEVSL
ncbi:MULTISPECIES: hypothetical protein [unclassified Aureimonas]|uniref:hypothetical protein n=1 Tax=unclassified Aureimonas TaxID=2615206 RepID=UPI000701D065|nr:MULTISPECIES: hypothetical protein [unclassified Aureimonas]KQT52230.1 hypothetical protein ASG62_16360 [Aureimonas sp. Leaf427]KQT70536.1 hypothetical protein ASG54_21590 [Aureimonas sp. Leaf460]